MLLGLCNSPTAFKKLMNHISHACIHVSLSVYMDDLLIFSSSREVHFKHLEILLQRLHAEKLYLSLQKCAFMKEETAFLGMVVGRKGI